MNDALVYLRFNTGWMIFVKFSPKIWVMKTHFLRGRVGSREAALKKQPGNQNGKNGE